MLLWTHFTHYHVSLDTREITREPLHSKRYTSRGRRHKARSACFARGAGLRPAEIPFERLLEQEAWSLHHLSDVHHSTFTLFTRRHFSHFQIPPNFYFSDTDPFPFTISDLRFSDSRFHTS